MITNENQFVFKLVSMEFWRDTEWFFDEKAGRDIAGV